MTTHRVPGHPITRHPITQLWGPVLTNSDGSLSGWNQTGHLVRPITVRGHHDPRSLSVPAARGEEIFDVCR